MTTIARGDAVALLAALVRADSRNPSLVAGAPGEQEAARVLAEALGAWGFRVQVVEAAPGRPNVIARVGGAKGGRSLILNGHLDVVGVEGMVHEPFAATVRDGLMYGRGSADMKGGVAAMCAAAARAADAGTLAGEAIVTAVIDEEWASAGTAAVVASGIRADAALVTEPTRCTIMPAHRGFAWFTVTVHGRAAHGSRYDIGIDAIRLAGLLLRELDLLDAGELAARTHPLLGRASLHASSISGGIGMSTYPDRCVLRVERRTLPGETPADVRAQIIDACERVHERRPEFKADISFDLAQGPSDVATGAPIVRALSEAITAEGKTPHIEGMTAWTDAALLNDAGIPAICYGPGDIALAHAAEEYVPLAEVEEATRVMTRVVSAWCGGSGPWPA